MNTKIETKQFNGHIVEVKQETRNGVPVGIITGYIATWDIDRGNDKFLPGAFLDSINEHKLKNSRQIRFKDSHRKTVGGFPIDKVFEDSKGLFGVGEINLDTEKGKEAYSLAKQGVLTDFSIGFSAIDWEIKDEIRIISKAIIWEGSIVDEPMNEMANITDIKTMDNIIKDKFTTEQVKKWDVKELEQNLNLIMSNSAAKMMACRLKTDSSQSEIKRLLTQIQSTKL